MIKVFLSLTLFFHCVTNINAMNLKQKYGKSFDLSSRLCRAMDNTNTSSDFSDESFHCNGYERQTYKVGNSSEKCYEIDSDKNKCDEFHNKLKSAPIVYPQDSFFSDLKVDDVKLKLASTYARICLQEIMQDIENINKTYY